MIYKQLHAKRRLLSNGEAILMGLQYTDRYDNLGHMMVISGIDDSRIQAYIEYMDPAAGAAAGSLADIILDESFEIVYFEVDVYYRYWENSNGSVDYDAEPVWARSKVYTYEDDNYDEMIDMITFDYSVGPGQTR
ncbi:MAG: hypothetical protein LBU94_02455 [Clostridiales bacterium]|jgi:hypothetical protein|nr:hypothetical protein [Clostridiales bacterium]